MTAGMKLDQKKVVVIGGSSGIGFAVAELAKECGAAIVLGSSSKKNVDAAIARLPGAAGHVVNLRVEENVAAFFEEVGAFDHLAITAGDWGVSWMASAREMDLERARDAMAVRFWGVLLAVKYGVRSIATDGSIVLTSGMLAHRPMKGAPLATAFGGIVEHLAKGLAVDLAPVRVNAVCPGLVTTEHVKTQMPEAYVRSLVGQLPLPRAATPEDAAKAYVYLMMNDYATAQVLPVDGGGFVV